MVEKLEQYLVMSANNLITYERTVALLGLF